MAVQFDANALRAFSNVNFVETLFNTDDNNEIGENRE